MSHAKQLHHRRYLHDYLEIIHREGLPGHVKNDLCLQGQEVVITTVQQVIEAALEEELRAYLGLDCSLWGVPHQRCIFHKIKNLAEYLGFNDLKVESAKTQEQAVREAKRARKQAVLAEASWVYEGQSAAEIESRARLFAMIWQGREPKAVPIFG